MHYNIKTRKGNIVNCTSIELHFHHGHTRVAYVTLIELGRRGALKCIIDVPAYYLTSSIGSAGTQSHHQSLTMQLIILKEK